MQDDDVSVDNMENYSWTSTTEGISSYFTIFLTLLATVLILSGLLHKRAKLASYLPEAGMIILVGMIASSLIYLISGDGAAENINDRQGDDDEQKEEDVADGLLSFSPTVFFVALLPPIIFNSGYHIRKEYFFCHMSPIVLFSCLGTAISAVVVALILWWATSAGLTDDFKPTFTELLTFGALISATDPVSTLAVFQEKRVDPQLFYLVFGESVLNDAVGLVLFTTLGKFVGKEESFGSVSKAVGAFLLDFFISFLGSLLLGLASGVVVGFVLKVSDIRSTRFLEISFYLLIMYIPFFVAELLPLSGIVTSLFTGIAAKQYAEPNLSPQTQQDSDLLFRVTAHLAETSIFLELGLSVFGLSTYGNFHYKFILFSLLGCITGRLANVYPLTLLFNLSLKRKSAPRSNNSTEAQYTMRPIDYETQKIKMKTAHMLWFSGLRGAVAYACSKHFPDRYGNRSPFVITTIVIVLVTVFLLGGTTEIALSVLNIEMNVDEDRYIEEQMQKIPNTIVDVIERRFILPYVLRDKPDTNDSNGSDRNDAAIELANFHSGDDQRACGDDEVGTHEFGLMQKEDGEKKSSLYDYGSRERE